MDLCDIRQLKPLLTRHGFHFSKSLGQNFLIECWVPERICQEAQLDQQTSVLEIGPGVGTLTVHLASQAGQVAAVELDRALFPVLDETLEGQGNVTVVHGDIMKLDLDTFINEHLTLEQRKVCANLPYQITTPVLTKLLESKQFSALVVMIQREVARRICAEPGTADYGAFTVLCQYHARCEFLFDVPPSCFLPQPKVTSSVVRLTPYSQAPVDVGNETLFFQIVRAAFAQRRKTLLNALSAAFGNRFQKEELRQILSGCGLDGAIRGERLSIPEFTALAQKMDV